MLDKALCKYCSACSKKLYSPKNIDDADFTVIHFWVRDIFTVLWLTSQWFKGLYYLLSFRNSYVDLQVGYAEKIASVWEKVAQETSGYACRSEDSLSFGTSI